MKKPRKLKLGICSRCKRQREIYHIGKQLCGSCRQLEALYKNPERYARYRKRQKENYWKNREWKLAYNHKYYRTGNHAEKMRAYGRIYAKEHKEKYREYKKKWDKEHPEIIRERARKYYQKYKVKRLANAKEWRKKHPKEIREYRIRWENSPKGKKWLQEYSKKPKIIEKRKEYREKHRERYRAYSKRPDVRARARVWRQKPENKKKKTEYDKEYDKVKRAKEIINKLNKIQMNNEKKHL